jgi:hypothetical protein
MRVAQTVQIGLRGRSRPAGLAALAAEQGGGGVATTGARRNNRFACLCWPTSPASPRQLSWENFGRRSADVDTSAVTALDSGYVGKLIDFN